MFKSFQKTKRKEKGVDGLIPLVVDDRNGSEIDVNCSL